MLIRAALRISALEAIDKVAMNCDLRDSQIAAFDASSLPKADLPFVAVYTDEDQKLTIIIGITAGAGTTTADGNNQVVDAGGSSIPVTDAGMEFVLDVLEWRIRQALVDETCPWAEWFNRVGSPDLKSAKSVRGAMRDKESNIPFAGREITLPLAHSVRDPFLGEAIDALPVWQQFFALLETDQKYAVYLEQFRAALGSGIDDWRDVYRAFALNSASVAALGQIDVEPNA